MKAELGAGKNTKAKFFTVSSQVTKKSVPRLMASLEVVKYSTGKKIGSETSGWVKGKFAGCDIDMSHFGNKGYVETKCTAYGTHEAIIKKAYTIYTSKIY